MTLYPKQLTQRFPSTMNTLLQRVTKLESRTSSIDSGFPLAVLPATIDPSYTGTGNPKAFVNGSATLSGPYAFVGSVQPKAGDNVLLQPVPAQQAYVIAGTTGAGAAFSPAQQVITSNVNTTSNAYVTAASVSVTTDGRTDAEIYCKWNYGELPVSDGQLTIELLIGSSVVDTVTMWSYDQPLADGGSITHRTSTARGDRPSAGTHTITMQFSMNGATSGNPGTLAAPIELYVAPI